MLCSKQAPCWGHTAQMSQNQQLSQEGRREREMGDRGAPPASGTCWDGTSPQS